MSPPLLALRAAIRARLTADGPLAAASGGSFLLADDPPRGVSPVYALWGPASARDASTTGVAGHETTLAITVWAIPGSAASGLRVADRIAALLDDAPLGLVGHHLVSLGLTGVATERDPDTGAARITLDLRAATEVAAT